jgi:hypothetical protein
MKIEAKAGFTVGLLSQLPLSRLEVMDPYSNRILVKYVDSMVFSIQDDGRTLKIFLGDDDPKVAEDIKKGLKEFVDKIPKA